MRSRRPLPLATLAAAFAVVVFGLPGCSLFDKKVDILLIGDSIMSQSAQFTELSLIHI